MSQEGTVHVLALFTAAPGKEDELERVLLQLIEPTRREAGCIRDDLVRGMGRSAELAFIEEWETTESLDAHSQAEHVRRIQSEAASLMGAPASIERYRLIR
jgi:quinol monooxygenase YgiN